MHTSSWAYVLIHLEDTACHLGGTQSRPCFESTMQGTESRDRFLFLPKVVADAWHVAEGVSSVSAVVLYIAYTITPL